MGNKYSYEDSYEARNCSEQKNYIENRYHKETRECDESKRCGDGKFDSCDFTDGNVSKPIEINKNSNVCEIKVDMEIGKKRTVRIWGQIRDCKGRPVRGAMVKLIKEVISCGKKRYTGVAHGITDCMGFYQFDVCVPQSCQGSERYRVIVSKQAEGEELVIDEAECYPCYDECGCQR